MAGIYVNIDGRPVEMDEDDYRDYMMSETSPYSQDTENRVYEKQLGILEGLLNSDVSPTARTPMKDALDNASTYLDKNAFRLAKRDAEYDEMVKDYLSNKAPELSSVSPMQKSDWENEDYLNDVNFNILRGTFKPGVRRFANNAMDFLGDMADFAFGKENENYDGGEDFFDNVPELAYLIPGAGQMLSLADDINNVYTGKRRPGALSIMYGAGGLKTVPRMVRTAKRYGNSFLKGVANGRARRAADEAVKRLPGERYVEPPKYQLFDKDGKLLLQNNDKIFRRKWY